MGGVLVVTGGGGGVLVATGDGVLVAAGDGVLVATGGGVLVVTGGGVLVVTCVRLLVASGGVPLGTIFGATLKAAVDPSVAQSVAAACEICIAITAPHHGRLKLRLLAGLGLRSRSGTLTSRRTPNLLRLNDPLVIALIPCLLIFLFLLDWHTLPRGRRVIFILDRKSVV